MISAGSGKDEDYFKVNVDQEHTICWKVNY